ncbi:MAG: hypothetical protein MEBIL_01638 [Bilophila sp.]
MATYRTIRMAFWSDPYIENLSASEKLLYLYLFSCPHTNNLGVLAVSRRRMAYDTGLTEGAVHAALAGFERDGKVATDGDAVFVCHFIRHQCSTSPKILVSLRSLFPTVESVKLRKAILALYPHLLGEASYPADRVSVPSGESEKEKEKEDQIRREGFFVSVDMLEALQRDFPDVDIEAEIKRVRAWQESQKKPIRNVWRFLRAWLSNAAGRGRGPARPVSPAPVPAFRPAPTPTDEDWENSRKLGMAFLEALRGTKRREAAA